MNRKVTFHRKNKGHSESGNFFRKLSDRKGGAERSGGNNQHSHEKKYITGGLAAISFIASAGVFLLISILFYNSILPAVLVIPAWPWIRKILEHMVGESRREKFKTEFRDFLNSLSGSFAVGRQMEEGLVEASNELRVLYGEKSLIVEETESLLAGIRSGFKPGRLLHDLADRWEIEEARELAGVYDACIETGGDISGALERAAVMLGEKLTIENDIRVTVSQKKYESRMIALMPPFILVFLRLISPGYLDVIYGTFAGIILMTFALIMTVAAFLWTERIAKIDV